MSINSVNPTSGAAAAYEAYQPPVQKRQAANSSSGVPTESIELSENSKYLKKIHDAIVAMPEIRIPIVEKIKERIKNDDYPIENHFNKTVDRMRDQNILSVF